uniref:DET1 homolog n=1 Tax=Rhabditophanes sp. KR3021 TaxID=114890 RepID=A0AC35UDY6_9BILA
MDRTIHDNRLSMVNLRSKSRKEISFRAMKRNLATNNYRPGTASLIYNRSLTNYIRINDVISNCEHMPGMFILKFSWDGKRMYTVYYDSLRVGVYDYLGIQNFRMQEVENSFPNVFKLKSSFDIGQHFNVVMSRSSVHKDLFYEFVGSPFIAIGLSRLAGGAEIVSNPNEINGDTIEEPRVCDSLEVVIMNIETGEITDSYKTIHGKKTNALYFVTFRKFIFAVLIQSAQTIDVVQLDKVTGKCQLLQRIGRNVYHDDQVYLSMNRNGDRFQETCMSGLKQKIMAFIVKNNVVSALHPNKFHFMSGIKGLKMSNLQLIKENIIFIKFTQYSINNPNQAVPEDQNIFYFILYDWTKAEVLGVYDHHSMELVNYIIKNNSDFKHSCPPDTFSCSNRHINTPKDILIRPRKIPGLDMMITPLPNVKKFLGYYPLRTTPCCSRSPFFDTENFQLTNGKITLNPDLDRIDADQFFRVYNKIQKRSQFELLLPGVRKQQTQLLFHPTDPFIIVVDILRNYRPCIFFLPKGGKIDEEMIAGSESINDEIKRNNLNYFRSLKDDE